MKSPIIEIDYEDWESRPAYIRRKMVFENSRGEVAKSEKSEHNAGSGNGNVSMF